MPQGELCVPICLWVEGGSAGTARGPGGRDGGRTAPHRARRPPPGPCGAARLRPAASGPGTPRRCDDCLDRPLGVKRSGAGPRAGAGPPRRGVPPSLEAHVGLTAGASRPPLPTSARISSGGSPPPCARRPSASCAPPCTPSPPASAARRRRSAWRWTGSPSRTRSRRGRCRRGCGRGGPAAGPVLGPGGEPRDRRLPHPPGPGGGSGRLRPPLLAAGPGLPGRGAHGCGPHGGRGPRPRRHRRPPRES